MTVKANRIAVFIDAENVTHWIKNDGMASLLNELKQLGQIIIRRAYGVWSRPQLAMHQASINKYGFELIHCYHPVTGKNTADIQMTVDVIECAWQLPNINCFVLVTGDSDFSPVFRRLREMEKEVIGVGQHSTLSECVKTSCSRFIYTDEVDKNSQLSLSKDTLITQTTAPKILNHATDNPMQLVKEANRRVIQCLIDAKGAINTSQLKNILVTQLAFDEKKFNFASFTDFLTGIPGVKLTKVGTVSYATYEDIKQTLNTKDQKQVSSELYLGALKKHNLRLISATRLKAIYKQAVTIKGGYSEMMALKVAVFTECH